MRGRIRYHVDELTHLSEQTFTAMSSLSDDTSGFCAPADGQVFFQLAATIFFSNKNSRHDHSSTLPLSSPSWQPRQLNNVIPKIWDDYSRRASLQRPKWTWAFLCTTASSFPCPQSKLITTRRPRPIRQCTVLTINQAESIRPLEPACI
jgi:hypothetical protein